MNQEQNRLRKILASDDVKKTNNKLLEELKNKGVDFDSFDSIKFNINLIQKIKLGLDQQKNNLINFNNTEDKSLLDLSEFVDPQSYYEACPEIAKYEKIKCYVEIVEGNPDVRRAVLNINYKEGCLDIRDCSQEVIFTNLFELVNHNIYQCNKRFHFCTSLDGDIINYVEDYKESIGLAAIFERDIVI